MITGNATVTLVQGEAYLYTIEIDSTSAEFVTDIYISCKDLNFCHQLIQNVDNNKRWSYQFTSDETNNFKPSIFTYSVTIHNSLESLNPQILIEQTFRVLKNYNPQTCEV